MGTIPGLANKVMDINNKVASNFVMDHYSEMVAAALRFGASEDCCNDAVHDVYLSLKKSEENGEGWGTVTVKGNVIPVEAFVFSRLKKYCINPKYRGKFNKNEESVSPVPVDSESVREMSDVERVYSSACSYDDIESIELELSVSEELEYLLQFEGMKYIVKNLYELATRNYERSLMDGVKALMIKNEEFAEAFKSVVAFAANNSDKYRLLVANI